MAYIAEYTSGRGDGSWIEVYVRHVIAMYLLRPNSLDSELIFEDEIDALWIDKGLSYPEKIKAACEFLERKGLKKTSERHTGKVR